MCMEKRKGLQGCVVGLCGGAFTRCFGECECSRGVCGCFDSGVGVLSWVWVVILGVDVSKWAPGESFWAWMVDVGVTVGIMGVGVLEWVLGGSFWP